ncbi:hypothetical protein FHW79_005558 [Azospirillum sp. OGB3]|uniref:peptidase G2 autoproteolytic cleavage domain-containing protein n=1 Tax=Azospirillum sp. OGB3 TaxID=2587012 RepID=UPI001606DB24|nr:peptidase G2 autoproteolytic cleavage domain-containing protein [Azospirillum sp. OGB3]MBB3267888.1 hypothetical protein [Azospirillum sp. OGB3]
MSGAYHHDMIVPLPLPPLQVTGGSAAAAAVGFAGDPDTGLFSPAADTLAIATGGAERVRVDAGGRMGVGCSPTVPLEVRAGTPQIRLYDGNAVDARWYTVAGGGATVFGNLSNHVLALYANNAEFLRGQPDGKVGIGTFFPGARLHVASTGQSLLATTSDSASPAMRAHVSHGAYASQALLLDADRPGSNGFMFLQARAGVSSTPDTKFKLLGDGSAYADGAWTGGGADYAEFFEWADGNPDAEDRRGLAVVLESGRIRPALASDPPARIVGVVGANPTIVGDAAWNCWAGKYRRDDYGSLLTEEYELVEWQETVPAADPGAPPDIRPHRCPADAIPQDTAVPPEARRTVQRRPILNPAFDPARPYRPRAERPEWTIVGLMGKLRVRQGQPTGDRWMKLCTVSPTVEEWLVR